MRVWGKKQRKYKNRKRLWDQFMIKSRDVQTGRQTNAEKKSAAATKLIFAQEKPETENRRNEEVKLTQRH